MKKVFCDACNKEIEHVVSSFEVLCHIGDDPKGSYAFIERDDNGRLTDLIPTSGRTDHYDLCSRCYNEVYGAAFEKFKQLGGVKK